MSLRHALVLLMVSVAIALCSCGHPAAFSQGVSTLDVKVRSEYPKALPRVEEFYTRCTGSGTLITSVRVGSPDQHIIESKCTFSINKNFQQSHNAYKAKKGERSQELEKLLCRNSKYAFWLKRESPDKPFTVGGYGPASDTDFDEDLGSAFRDFVYSPFSILGVPISELMADPSFSISKVSEVIQEGRQLVRIDFRFTAPPKNPRSYLKTGWFLVAPEQGWVLRKFECKHFDDRTTSEGTVDYAEHGEGIPIVKQATVSFPSHQIQRRFIFDSIRSKTVPESDFTLTAFGLPEIGETRENSYKTRIHYWLFGLAFASLIVALVLRHLGNRAQRA